MIAESVAIAPEKKIAPAKIIAPEKKKAPAKKRLEAIPDYLVAETIDGIPFYYRGYRDVLNKTKTIEEIMPDSGLQQDLKTYIGDVLKAHLDRKQYKIYAGETGAHAGLRDNMGLDVTVYDRSILTPDKITNKYIDVPPKIVVEIDVNVEAPNPMTELFSHFVLRKMRKLFAFGTEKVIWIFTQGKIVMVAAPDSPLQILDWDEDVELLNGIKFNVAKYLEEEGINPDLA